MQSICSIDLLHRFVADSAINISDFGVIFRARAKKKRCEEAVILWETEKNEDFKAIEN